jgi:hypothetical protein
MAHTCGIRADGTLACWGDDASGQIDAPAGAFTQLSAGLLHTCALRTDGTIACWGRNDDGRASPPAGTFTEAAAGYWHSCGLKSDGTAACWGDDAYGSATPPLGKFIDITAGGYFTCGLRASGNVVCWGDNRAGQASPPATVTVAPQLSVATSGTGTILSSPTAITCPPACEATLADGALVTLTYFSNPSVSTFAGWGGDCSGRSAECTLVMDNHKSVTAAFAGAATTIGGDGGGPFPISVPVPAPAPASVGAIRMPAAQNLSQLFCGVRQGVRCTGVRLSVTFRRVGTAVWRFGALRPSSSHSASSSAEKVLALGKVQKRIARAGLVRVVFKLKKSPRNLKLYRAVQSRKLTTLRITLSFAPANEAQTVITRDVKLRLTR